eukprot:5838990-Pleurochrysis_carterae.AAC.1
MNRCPDCGDMKLLNKIMCDDARLRANEKTVTWEEIKSVLMGARDEFGKSLSKKDFVRVTGNGGTLL